MELYPLIVLFFIAFITVIIYLDLDGRLCDTSLFLIYKITFYRIGNSSAVISKQHVRISFFIILLLMLGGPYQKMKRDNMKMVDMITVCIDDVLNNH